jgi:uncharacterized protein (TIGR03067 family)
MKSKMSIIIILFCLGGLFMSACNHTTGLEGTWVGCDVRNPLIDWSLTVLGNQFYLVREDLSMWYVGKFNLNNNCLLKKIDLKFSNTHIQVTNETTLLGIYETDGNSLTLITSKPGARQRPASFDENGKAVIFNFVRS